MKLFQGTPGLLGSSAGYGFGTKANLRSPNKGERNHSDPQCS